MLLEIEHARIVYTIGEPPNRPYSAREVIPGQGSDFIVHQFADGLKHVVLLELREGEEIERETVGVYDETIYGPVQARQRAKDHFADLLARLKS